MKKAEDFVVRNWIWITAGCILQRKAIEYSYFQRGYKAIGGEWLIIPAIFLAVSIYRDARKIVTEIMKDDAYE